MGGLEGCQSEEMAVFKVKEFASVSHYKQLRMNYEGIMHIGNFPAEYKLVKSQSPRHRWQMSAPGLLLCLSENPSEPFSGILSHHDSDKCAWLKSGKRTFACSVKSECRDHLNAHEHTHSLECLTDPHWSNTTHDTVPATQALLSMLCACQNKWDKWIVTNNCWNFGWLMEYGRMLFICDYDVLRQLYYCFYL